MVVPGYSGTGHKIPSQPILWQNIKTLSRPVPWEDFELVPLSNIKNENGKIDDKIVVSEKVLTRIKGLTNSIPISIKSFYVLLISNLPIREREKIYHGGNTF